MKRLVVVCCVASVLGCSSATGYRPLDAGGGYEDTRLQRNVFRVIFRANTVTPASRARDYALLRAAEIALQHGYRYFSADERSTVDQYRSRVMDLVVVCYAMRPKRGIAVHDAESICRSISAEYQINLEVCGR
jgi:hypothetical protein